MPSLANVLSFFIRLYSVLILIRVILSWVALTGPQPWMGHPVVHRLYRLTDPILRPFRRLIPPVSGLDISPVAALLVLEVVRQVLVALLG